MEAEVHLEEMYCKDCRVFLEGKEPYTKFVEKNELWEHTKKDDEAGKPNKLVKIVPTSILAPLMSKEVGPYNVLKEFEGDAAI
ncbi:hypothetical protein HPP92_000476 [Vanilla planifolia]|uniref:Uncharacterized protein n=1 Tax=Vanilla planifolia TaxID=51239 RepID=A0A835RY62_VANPL|nr:hypothetical protein HPP92_000476 [Vanilla planifolia]